MLKQQSTYPSFSTSIESIADPIELLSAWHRIRRNQQEKQTMQSSLESFEGDLIANIETLSDDLLSGRYRPQPLNFVWLPNKKGHGRSLHVPPIRDRLVESALNSRLSFMVDQRMSPLSFAYRPGLGTRDAIRVLKDLKQELGAGLALKCDIRDCFGSIRFASAFELLRTWLPGIDLLTLVGLFDSRKINGSTEMFTALPQGSPLSPLLANIYLSQLDDSLHRGSVPFVRYADDICVLAKTAPQLEKLETTLENSVNKIGLELQAEKTKKMSFADGFVFLGEPINDAKSTPSEVEKARPHVLYVAKPGSSIRVQKGRIRVLEKETELLSVPQSQVQRIVTFGPVGVSAGVRQWAMYSGIDWDTLSARGRYLGTMTPFKAARFTRRLTQQRRLEGSLGMGLAREAIGGKISHCISLIKRHAAVKENSDLIGTCLNRLQVALDSISTAPTIGSIMGIEGSAASSYWNTFKCLLPADTGFEARKKRPSPDPINAALSFGYAVLSGEAVGALVATGLDPGFGFLHKLHDGRASLALDLIEEFRPLIIDTIVLEIAKRAMMRKDFALVKDGEARLTSEGKRILLSRYEQRMTTLFSYSPDFKCSYRRALHLQAQSISRSLDSKSIRYRSLLWRS